MCSRSTENARQSVEDPGMAAWQRRLLIRRWPELEGTQLPQRCCPHHPVLHKSFLPGGRYCPMKWLLGITPPVPGRLLPGGARTASPWRDRARWRQIIRHGPALADRSWHIACRGRGGSGPGGAHAEFLSQGQSLVVGGFSLVSIKGDRDAWRPPQEPVSAAPGSHFRGEYEQVRGAPGQRTRLVPRPTRAGLAQSVSTRALGSGSRWQGVQRSAPGAAGVCKRARRQRQIRRTQSEAERVEERHDRAPGSVQVWGSPCGVRLGCGKATQPTSAHCHAVGLLGRHLAIRTASSPTPGPRRSPPVRPDTRLHIHGRPRRARRPNQSSHATIGEPHSQTSSACRSPLRYSMRSP